MPVLLIKSSLVFLLSVPFAFSQDTGINHDSLRLERLVMERSHSDFSTSARALLLRRVKGYQFDQGVELLTFMERRKGTKGWITPDEEVLAQLLLMNTTFLLDTNRIAELLKARLSHYGGHGIIKDNLYNDLSQNLRGDPDEILRRVERGGKNEEERRFLEILVNGLAVRGVRKTENVNQRVAQFVQEYPNSPYGRIAEDYLQLNTVQATIGGGLFAGYTFGGAVTGLSGTAFGPFFSGELYIDHVLLSVSLFAGVLTISDSFSVADRFWRSGDASLTGGSLDIGYEGRSNNVVLTPFVGLTLYELQEGQGVSLESDDLFTTGSSFGFQAGVMAGLRVPFDVPPHIDLKLRFALIQPGFTSYSEQLESPLFLTTLSFGLIQRPYTTRPGRSR